MNKIYCAIIMASIVLAACSSNEKGITAELKFNADTVAVRNDSPILERLQYGKAICNNFSTKFSTVGTIQAPNGCYAEVSVPFDGRVNAVKVHLGSKVVPSQTLFEISSSEFLEISKLYFQNVKNHQTAQANFERKKSLESSGIISRRELEEAETEAENARHELECTCSSIRVFGIDPSSIAMGQAQKIVSPIRGEVVSLSLTPGSFIKADAGAVATIADLSNVWVTAQVKERDVDLIQQGQQAKIITDATADDPIIGTVRYIGKVVDEQTRSVQVVVECENHSSRLRHGMYSTVQFICAPKPTLMIPTTAVFQGDGMTYVFCCGAEKNVFLRRKVDTGDMDEQKKMICILGGLETDDVIVTEGGLYLNN